MPEPSLLLDSHVWVWYAAGCDLELSRTCVRAIEEARARRAAFVSAVSVREVALLAAHRRLSLTLPAEEWTRRALGPLGLVPLPLDITEAARSADLPGTFHRDPADRMLVAQARVHGLTLVTRDRAILDWARGGWIRTMDALPPRKGAGRRAK
jgi:PIN domain nuclease of toxin-antitoxin system